MTPVTSTAAFVGGLFVAWTLAAVGICAYVMFRRKRRREAPEITYLRAHAVRLGCAQHWARGALLSQSSEAWQPLCGAFALAALACESDQALADIVQRVANSTEDRELLNIGLQAGAELEAMRARLDAVVLTGRTVDGASHWPLEELRQRAIRLVAEALQEAGKLIEAKRAAPAS